MKKPFNMRLPVLFAASLCAGILYSTVLAYFRLRGIFILIPSFIAFAACVPVAIIKGGVSKPLIIIAATVFFLVGAVYLFAKYTAFESPDVMQGVAVRISGKVSDTGVSSGGRQYVILSRVSVNGEKIDGKIAAYLVENTEARRGYTVDFYARLEKQNFIEFGAVGYNACRGVKYICTVSGGVNPTYRFDLFGEINYAFERALFDNLDGETAAVCFAMLTGNTGAISEGTLTSFRNGGIAHVFAVSGLHIGVIFGALTFIFRKAGVNRFVSAAARIILIFLYSGVCLFSPSSVRALVMCSAAAVAGCFYRKHDSLNALAVAAVILLLVNPLYLYGAGFALSFAAMLGILLLSKNFSRLFGFLPKKLNSALSAGISAQIATVPVQLTSFGYISAAGLALNFIFIPLVSVLYVLLFICACISAVIPASAGALMPFAATPVRLIINIVNACGFENSLISGRFSNALYLPFALLFAGFTDKLNLRPLARAVFLCAFALTPISASVKATASDTFAIVEFDTGYSGGAVTIKTEEGTVLVVTENFRKRSDFSEAADILVVLGGYDSLSVVTLLGADYDEIYMRGSAFPLPELGATPIKYTDSFTVFDIDFRYDGDLLTADVYDTEIALASVEGAYGGGNSGSALELYCHNGDGAVLYAEGGSYALDTCGAMRFEISERDYNRLNVIPKE